MGVPDGADWYPVRIERDAIYIGGQQLPGMIAEDGVVFRPGPGGGPNTLTVTFLVGDITSIAAGVNATESGDATQFRSTDPARLAATESRYTPPNIQAGG